MPSPVATGGVVVSRETRPAAPRATTVFLVPPTRSARRRLLTRVPPRPLTDSGIPTGGGAVGYAEPDVDDLVEGTLMQQRLLATAPREATAEDLARILRGSLELW